MEKKYLKDLTKFGIFLKSLGLLIANTFASCVLSWAEFYITITKASSEYSLYYHFLYYRMTLFLMKKWLVKYFAGKNLTEK